MYCVGGNVLWLASVTVLYQLLYRFCQRGSASHCLLAFSGCITAGKGMQMNGHSSFVFKWKRKEILSYLNRPVCHHTHTSGRQTFLPFYSASERTDQIYTS